MKFTLYVLGIVFMLGGCQAGRGMPVHPSMQKTILKNKTTIQKDNSFKVDKFENQNFPTLKLKGKDLADENTLFSSIPIVNKIAEDMLPSINDIPLIRDIKKLLPSGSKVAKTRVKKKVKVFSTESFSGGSPVDGLDIGLVRLGQSNTYTRLIFDTYKWEGYAQIPVTKVNDSGTYIFTYEPRHKRITAILDGYQAFSALVGEHEDLYVGNNMVSTIHLDEYLDQSGFKFTIELKQEANIRVYELHNPARIIIDMFPHTN